MAVLPDDHGCLRHLVLHARTLALPWRQRRDLRGRPTIGTEDWDELADAQAAGLVTQAEHDAAVRAARALEHAFAEGLEPFGRVGWERLAAAVALGLPPLTDFGNRPLG
ncbi:hypothetical protein [Kribbella sp. NPDC004875]|uniref:hypothetical protein n=1 Tax=Kribbella sp. NPDC004875 TaxID=3364107 RepID=UPI0036ABCA81